MAPGALHGFVDTLTGEGHEADAGIEPEGLGPSGGRSVALHPAEVEIGDAQLLGLLPPEVEGPLGVGQLLGPVDEHERPTVDLDVAIVGKGGGQPPDVGQVVGLAELLGHQHLAGAGVPVAGPLLVGPAEGEREVRRTRGQHLVEGPLEQPLPVEPVVVVDESRHPVGRGQVRLRLADLGEAEVVVAEITGDVGLVVPRVERPGPVDTRPLGEPLAPPLVVLGDGVELRQVEGQGPRLVGHAALPPVDVAPGAVTALMIRQRQGPDARNGPGVPSRQARRLTPAPTGRSPSPGPGRPGRGPNRWAGTAPARRPRRRPAPPRWVPPRTPAGDGAASRWAGTRCPRPRGPAGSAPGRLRRPRDRR